MATVVREPFVQPEPLPLVRPSKRTSVIRSAVLASTDLATLTLSVIVGFWLWRLVNPSIRRSTARCFRSPRNAGHAWLLQPLSRHRTRRRPTYSPLRSLHHPRVPFSHGRDGPHPRTAGRLPRRPAPRVGRTDRIRLVSTSGTICIELVKKIQMSGSEIGEVPVNHYSRQHGRSQFFRWRSLWTTFRQLLSLYFHLVLFGGGGKVAGR